ncbi:MAG: low molecular weight phosphotyrosine protein phosphatase [Spirochaeta sp.]|nr:low molecular weight phosphotyrosine protein phosphatase [Spirochaeta sp.]
MFVCSGNICRSPLAHRMLEHQAKQRGMAEHLTVESSGTGAWHVGQDADPRMRKTAAAHGLTFHHPARMIERSDLVDYDVLFAMDRGHYRQIRAMGRHNFDDELASRVYVFRQFDPLVAGDGVVTPEDAPDVPDPYYGGKDGFEEVYRIVERTCSRILDEITAGNLP